MTLIADRDGGRWNWGIRDLENCGFQGAGVGREIPGASSVAKGLVSRSDFSSW